VALSWEMSGSKGVLRNQVCAREPSESRASTQGDVASTRRPSGATMRSITRRTASSASNRRSATLPLLAAGARDRAHLFLRRATFRFAALLSSAGPAQMAAATQALDRTVEEAAQ
jgi:hypothetical protein